MGNMNVTRIVLGGLLAGLVLNVGELVNGMLTGEALAEHMAELGITEVGAAQAVMLVASAFITGIVIVWLYAAIRPRFGAGVKTALLAGFAVWLIAGLVNGISLVAMGLLPAGAMTIAGTAVALVQFLVAAVAGAWLYTESAAA